MPQSTWHAVSELRQQFLLNNDVLRARDPTLAAKLHDLDLPDLFIRGDVNDIVLGRRAFGLVRALPNPVPPRGAEQIAQKLFPTGACTDPVLVAGLDHGWLWQRLFDMEVSTPRTPGHRPPLYFLSREIERLWAVMHFHDWTRMLADNRVRLIAGDDSVNQLIRELVRNPLVPWPKLCVTIDPAIWPAGMSVDTVLRRANDAISPQMNHCTVQLSALDASVDAREFAARCRGRLRVLGITSRFTTFLQYSMRDWLAAFENLGHDTRLLIEQNDHEIVNPLGFAQACADFRPDLLLMIDHYRAEFTGLPQRVPCVMWVQDRLSNIFRPDAGAAQSQMDFVIGYGRQECALSFGYPSQRFMPAMIGCNERRFTSAELTGTDRQRHACDVSFVSHASTPPEVLVQQEIDKSQLPEVRKFLHDVFDRLRAIYETGTFVTEVGHIRGIVRAAMGNCGIQTSNFGGVLDFFGQRVNNALFRQQAVRWLAEMDVNLRLYGQGWEKHAEFSRFARGVADNESQLCAIYRASTINMQITPFGAVHQRLCDGLAAGGFFLLRHCTGDSCDLIYRDLWQWIEQMHVRSGPQLLRQAPPHIQELLDRIADLTAEDVRSIPDRFFFGLEELAAGGFTRAPSTLWPNEYDRVAFTTRAELHDRVKHFLAAPDERQEIAAAMRGRALECMSYRGITERMLRFISDQLDSPEAMQIAA
jgi:hypothetical protein